MTIKQPDWERIEQLFRAGVLSLREIAAACPGSNHVAIARRAKKHGWVQDLSAKIKAKANDLVTRQGVTADVTAERAVTDRAVIEVNAQAIANIRMAHRGDISRSRRLTNKLLDELEALTDEQGTIKELIAQLKDAEHDDGDAMADVLALANKMGALPSRTKTMKELAETLKTLVALERQAYDLDTKASGNDVDELSSMMDELSKEA
jgi:formate dehydrogenase maturation protein FdhE